MSDEEDGGENDEAVSVPDWVTEASKEEVYWRTLYEAKQEEAEEARRQLADQTQTWAGAFQEGIRNLSWNMSTSQNIPKTGWGDVNIGITAKDIVSGMSPILSLAAAGAGIGGYFTDTVTPALSLALIGVSIGTGLSWYYYEFHKGTDSISDQQVPNRPRR